MIPHRIERTSNRHSRAVVRGSEIVIRLGRNLSEAEERRHIENLLRRMTKHVQKESTKTAIDPFRALLEGSEHAEIVLNNGTRYNIGLMPGTKTRVRSDDSGWTITIDPKIRREQLHSLLWNLVTTREVQRIATLVGDINLQTFNERLGPVGFQYMSSQWGSCGRGGRIMLNSALLFVPEALLRYVIIHELAHIGHPNHSASFWRSVEHYCPDYWELKRALLMYRLPTLD